MIKNSLLLSKDIVFFIKLKSLRDWLFFTNSLKVAATAQNIFTRKINKKM